MLWLDKYERYARVTPGLLALLPVTITVAALGLRGAPVVSAAVSLLSLAGGPVLLASTVRDLGLKAQRRLWDSWGGSPTTIMLRLREAGQNDLQRDTWRHAIEKVSGLVLSSRRAETGDPKKADNTIEVAVGRLRELTRTDEQRFPLIHAENRGYGFQRNFYGVRWVGRAVALSSTLIIVGYMAWRVSSHDRPELLTPNILGLILDVLILLGWLVVPSAKSVRTAGDKYAYQLLQGAVSLAQDTSASTP